MSAAHYLFRRGCETDELRPSCEINKLIEEVHVANPCG